jgi:two-component system response regulator NreC
LADGPIRVVLCDDHRVIRSGLRRILEAEPDIEVVGEAGSAQECLAVARDALPDVVVLDIGLPGINGIEAARLLREEGERARILMLTVHDDVAYLRRAFEAGASGYLVKEAADIELVLAVRQVAEGRPYVHPSLGAALLTQEPGPRDATGPAAQLSERETEVLRLIALGHTNAEIAASLFLSVRTVESHRAHIQQKLGVRNRSDLVAYARAAGVLGHAAGSPPA